MFLIDKIRITMQKRMHKEKVNAKNVKKVEKRSNEFLKNVEDEEIIQDHTINLYACEYYEYKISQKSSK